METMPKTQRDHRYKVHCTNRHPSRDITRNAVAYINQELKKTVYLRFPAHFSTFRTEIFTTYSKITCKCTPNHSVDALVFSRQVWSRFVFHGIFISHISLEEQTTVETASQTLLGTYGTPCQNMTSKVVLLSGA